MEGMMVFTRVLLFLILTSCSYLGLEKPTTGTGDLGIELDVQKFVLDNGLRLLVVENPQLPIFSYYTFYDIGGRHEGPGTTGATHFLEHMMFKGSKKYGPGVFDNNIEKRGGMNNAFTSFDATVYFENMPAESLELVIDMEADRTENILLIPESVERERNIIFEERKMRYENSPHGKLYLAMTKAVFEGTPYGGSVIGDVADLRKLTRDNLMNFYKRFYRPNNAVIVVAGAVESSEVHRMVREKMGHLKYSSDLVEYKREKDNPGLFTHRGRYKRDIKLKGTNPLPIFTLAFRGVPFGGRQGFALDLLSSILGDGESSYLSEKFIKNESPILSSVSVANYTLKHNGVFFIMGQPVEGKEPEEIKDILLKELEGICARAVTERSVQKTRNQYLAAQFHQIQTNAGVARYLGQWESSFGDFNHYKRELEAYQTIPPGEIARECESLFEEGDYIYLSIWNKH